MILHNEWKYIINYNEVIKEASCRLDLMSSRLWALKITTWIEHCLRHPGCPAARLLTCQDPLWLQTLRVLSGSLSVDAGQTRSRAGPGKPKRYLRPWYLMIDLQYSEHDKGQSRANAEIVWTAGWYGRLHGFEVWWPKREKRQMFWDHHALSQTHAMQYIHRCIHMYVYIYINKQMCMMFGVYQLHWKGKDDPHFPLDKRQWWGADWRANNAVMGEPKIKGPRSLGDGDNPAKQSRYHPLLDNVQRRRGTLLYSHCV